MISFITSLYRSDHHIQKYVHLIIPFHQTLFEAGIQSKFIIISNEPSMEERKHLKLLSEYSWVSIIEVPRETLYASWNRGVREAPDGHITFWNVDDERYPEAIISMMTEYKKSPVDVAYFPFRYKRYVRVVGMKVPAKFQTIEPAEFDKLRFKTEMHGGPFFVITKQAYEKVGCFDESFTIAGDFDWFTRAAENCSFKKIDTIAGTFTNDGRTLSGSRSQIQEEENKRIKGEDFMDKFHTYDDPYGNVRFYHHLKARRCIDFIKSNAAPEKIFLDAGAGRGPYTHVAKTLYKKIYCYEYDEKELEKAKENTSGENVEFGKVDLSAIPLADKSVDVIVCSEVLEHVIDNVRAVSELHRILKDDGVMLVSMPNRFSLMYQNVYSTYKSLWYGKENINNDFYFEQRRHLEYPFWKIEKLVKTSNFKIIRRIGANAVPIGYGKRKKLAITHPRLFSFYTRFEWFISTYIPWISSFYFIEVIKA